MPRTKVCPDCGALADLARYQVTPEMAGDAGDGHRAGDAIEVCECECGWQEDE